MLTGIAYTLFPSYANILGITASASFIAVYNSVGIFLFAHHCRDNDTQVVDLKYRAQVDRISRAQRKNTGRISVQSSERIFYARRLPVSELKDVGSALKSLQTCRSCWRLLFVSLQPESKATYLLSRISIKSLSCRKGCFLYARLRLGFELRLLGSNGLITARARGIKSELRNIRGAAFTPTYNTAI